MVNNHLASSVALAPITTSGRSISRRVWKAKGGVYERKEASETHVPWQAISPGTEQRYATPLLDVTRDNVCSLSDYAMIARRVESQCGLSIPSSDNGPNTPCISDDQGKKAHEYMLRSASLAEVVPTREGYAASCAGGRRMSPHESPQTTDPMPPAVALRHLLYGYRLSQAIYVAAKLSLADRLKDGPKGSDELATAVGAHPEALYRLLRVLASVGIFAEVDQRRFTLTPLGAFLQTDVPGSWWGTAVLTGEWWWPAYGALLYSVTTGQPAHEHVYGMRNFAYFAEHPDIGQLFHRRHHGTAGTVVHGSGHRL